MNTTSDTQSWYPMKRINPFTETDGRFLREDGSLGNGFGINTRETFYRYIDFDPRDKDRRIAISGLSEANKERIEADNTHGLMFTAWLPLPNGNRQLYAFPKLVDVEFHTGGWYRTYVLTATPKTNPSDFRWPMINHDEAIGKGKWAIRYPKPSETTMFSMEVFLLRSEWV